jgi:hypothetical protein
LVMVLCGADPSLHTIIGNWIGALSFPPGAALFRRRPSSSREHVLSVLEVGFTVAFTENPFKSKCEQLIRSKIDLLLPKENLCFSVFVEALGIDSICTLKHDSNTVCGWKTNSFMLISRAGFRNPNGTPT